MVDLSKLDKGWKVGFRCGGEAVVGVVHDAGDYRMVELEGSTHGYLMWLFNGKFSDEDSTTDPFDITSITPPEFDWDTVEPGEAFRVNYGTKEGCIVIFQSWSTEKTHADHRLALIGIKDTFSNGEGEYITYYPKHLTRAPEHDKKEI